MNDNQRAGMLWVIGCALVIAVLGVGAYMVGNDIGGGPDEPPAPDPRDVVWADLTTGERVRFCAEARAAGYTVVAAEMTDGGREAERDARYWLEDRCG